MSKSSVRSAPGLTVHPKRRKFQFRLRSCLILIVVISIPLGWLANERNKSQRLWAPIKALERLECGCYGAYDSGQYPTWWQKSLGIDMPAPQDSVWIRDTGEVFTEKEMVYLARLPQLKHVQIMWISLSDKGLIHLTRLRYLVVPEKPLPLLIRGFLVGFKWREWRTGRRKVGT